MMTIAWLFIKSAFSRIWPFIIEHWRIFLALAIVLVMYWQHYKLDRLQFEYDQHLLSDIKAMELRKAENLANEQKHQIEISLAHAEKLKLMAEFDLERKRDAKKLKDLYANKTNSEFRLNSYVDWMRLEQERKATGGVSAPDQDKRELAEGWRNCDAANTRLQEQYKTLEDACAITTLDYNELRLWGDSVCDVVGCK